MITFSSDKQAAIMSTLIHNTESNITNCTLVYVNVHIQGQSVILTLFLAYILLLNFLLIAVTVGTTKLRGCAFSMQLVASYVGNILGGISLVGNELYYTNSGIIQIGCHPGLDRNFFLYFGISMNMVIVVLNTRFRYKRTVSMKQNRGTVGEIRTRDLILKGWIPALFTSICLSVISSIVQAYVMNYQFLICVSISVIPLTISIIWNLLLGRFLKKSGKNPTLVQQPESLAIIKRAAFIIHVTIVVHVMFLAIGCAASLLVTFYRHKNIVVIAMTWLLRVVYVVLFTIEAEVYLYKMDVARNIIKRKILNFRDLLRCDEDNVNESNDIMLTSSSNDYSSVPDKSGASSN